MAAIFHIFRNSTRKYVRLFQSSGKSMEELLAMTEEQLRQELGQETVLTSSLWGWLKKAPLNISQIVWFVGDLG